MYGNMGKKEFTTMFTQLSKWIKKIEYAPIIDLMAIGGSSPFELLVSTMLSARTKDEITTKASKKLFSTANNIDLVLQLSVSEIEKLIYPVGFYKTKAVNLKKMCEILKSSFNYKIPETIEELTSLPGVGVKTASLVLIKAFDKPEICVDTHVHRICNLWQLVDTKTPDRTRTELKKEIDILYWKDLNQYLVTLGQLICTPLKRKCSKCPLERTCNMAHGESS